MMGVGVVLTKHAFIVDVFNTEPEACWEGADQDVEVKEKGHPGGGLVLGYGRNYGNVDLSVAADNVEDRQQKGSTVRWKEEEERKAFLTICLVLLRLGLTLKKNILATWRQR